ncbi:MAG TPA: uroporphyrinogen-III C-methyltransferase [Smithella sp.]|nr:uroporphyrinogen-III C-methyltransferase [Smithella sp.]HPK54734.1 uroporphyrinogen-III C-methyltransferase [Smithellaceae bacterium]HQN71660.1 uroporphyrinogen-III C-methyltransferase [Smithella sp.]HQP41815.1 uroporphyrinogen-III C-methyltransferase [Smithella sp.]
MMKKNKKGKVYIVGAGPGDAGLMTLKGIDCLREADVVIYDYLVSKDLLKYAKSDARFIYVGKQGGAHTLSQWQINDLLVKEAKAGNVVARLKGGDPFIFGRGGEEAEKLVANKISFEIVPGVTSAIAVPAYAGIPLTHRGLTSTVAFVTGHEDPTKEKSDINWSALSRIGTLVFLMGMKNIEKIVRELKDNGRSPKTPAALIRWGTTPRQKILEGTLADIVNLAKDRKFVPPAILIVGEVVALRDRLQWFDSKPLFGKGVVITRPEKQADDLAQLLIKEGATPIHFPTIKIVPPLSWRELDKAIKKLDDYDWLIFTSANGVAYFFERLSAKGKDIRDLKGIKICCIGPATARQVQDKGIRVDLIPGEFISEGILKSFARKKLKGKKILLARAAEARDVLPEGLKKLGARVDVATAYVTVTSGRKKNELEDLFNENQVDVITFTSSSTVNNFRKIMGSGFRLPEGVKIASIGPVTAATARKAGFPVDIHQEEYTMEGLVNALNAYFGKKSSGKRGKNK